MFTWVTSPEDRFSHGMAHIMTQCVSFLMTMAIEKWGKNYKRKQYILLAVN